MGLEDEFEKARNFIALDFAPSGKWSVFEFVIRFVGGFLSAYQMTEDPLFLEKAVACCRAILASYSNATGIPNSILVIRTQAGRLNASSRLRSRMLSEGGSCQLEFLTVSVLTSDMKFADTALKFYRHIWSRNPSESLPDVDLHKRNRSVAHLGAGSDSYYEYLIKTYVMTGSVSPKLLAKHNEFVREMRRTLEFQSKPNNLTGIGVRRDGKLDPTMEHLASFVPGLLALGTVKGNLKIESDLELADRLVRTFSFIQQKLRSGLLPEKMRFNIANASRGYDFLTLVDEYLLRPEAVESIYVLWKFTGLQKYRDIAWAFFQGIQKACKVRHGYASVSRVSRQKVKHNDFMESFFLAETLKYLYLTFSDSKLLSPTEWVFNTEAHPLRILTELPAELREMLQFKGVP